MILKAASALMVAAIVGLGLLSFQAEGASCVAPHSSIPTSFPKVIKGQNELIFRLNRVEGETGQIVRRYEGDEYYLTQNSQLRAGLARMSEQQDEVLSAHRVKFYPGMKASTYHPDRLREDLTAKLSIFADRLTKAKRQDKDFDLSTIKFPEWIGKLVYGTHFVFMNLAEMKKVSLLTEEGDSLTPQQSSVNDPRTKVAVIAKSYAGHIQQIQAFNDNGRVALKITIQDSNGSTFTILLSSMSILNELQSLRAVNPDY